MRQEYLETQNPQEGKLCIQDSPISYLQTCFCSYIVRYSS